MNVRCYLLCGLLLPAAMAQAGPFLGLKAGLAMVEVDDSNFRPWLTGLQAGWRDASRGWGAELHLSTGVRDDEGANLNFATELLTSAYATVSSTSEDQRAMLSLGAGYALLQTDTDTQGSGYPGSQSFAGPALLMRLEERLRHDSPWILHATYEHLFLDSDMSAMNFSLGASYAF